jgi:hypothetical protein
MADIEGKSTYVRGAESCVSCITDNFYDNEISLSIYTHHGSCRAHFTYEQAREIIDGLKRAMGDEIRVD